MPDEAQVSLVLERAHGWQRWEVESSQRDLAAIDDDEMYAFRNDAIAAGRARFDADASVADVLRALHLLDADGKPNRGAIALLGRSDAFAGEYPTLGCRLVAVTCSVPRRGHWLAPDGLSIAVSEPEATVLAVLADGPAARGQLAADVGASSATMREMLTHLRELGLVRVEGHGHGAQWLLSDGLPPSN